MLKHLLYRLLDFITDILRFKNFQFFPMPQKLLIEVIARNKSIFKNTPLVSGLYFLLRFMKRKSFNVFYLRTIYLNKYSFWFLVI